MEIVPVKERAQNLCDMIERHYAQDIVRVMPKALGMEPERFMVMVYTLIKQTPALVDCTPASLIGSVFRAAQAGLEPDGVHAALVPFRERGVAKAQFMPMYQGLIRMGMNSGLIASCQVPRLVYEDDFFEYEYGLHERLKHIPSPDPESRTPDKITYGYFIVTMASGERVWDVFPRAVFDAIRDRSRAKNGPWATDYGSMCQKTTVRGVMKYVPKSAKAAELQRVISRDEKFDAGIVDTDAEPQVVREFMSRRSAGKSLDDVGLIEQPNEQVDDAQEGAQSASTEDTPENFF